MKPICLFAVFLVSISCNRKMIETVKFPELDQIDTNNFEVRLIAEDIDRCYGSRTQIYTRTAWKENGETIHDSINKYSYSEWISYEFVSAFDRLISRKIRNCSQPMSINSKPSNL